MAKAKSKTRAGMVQIDYDRLRQVSGLVALQEVVLTGAFWQSPSLPAKLIVQPTFMGYAFDLSSASWDFHPDYLILEAQLAYQGAAFARAEKDDGNETEVSLFQVQCEWNVRFQVPEGFEPAASDIMADFVVANGQLNAFPYVRQFVQDITSRAGLPPLVLPTFRIPAKRPKQFGRRRGLKQARKKDSLSGA